MTSKFTGFLLLLLLTGIFQGQVKYNPSKRVPFDVGQVWSYHTRPGEEGSTLQIVRIDTVKANQKIIHISIDGLKIKDNRIQGGIQNKIPHAPITEDALRKSVIAMLRVEKKLRPYEEGYKLWKEAKAGAFTITVKELITYVEEALKIKPENMK